MKRVTITGIMADFLDSIRAYEHESGKQYILMNEKAPNLLTCILITGVN